MDTPYITMNIVIIHFITYNNEFYTLLLKLKNNLFFPKYKGKKNYVPKCIEVNHLALIIYLSI